MKLEPGSEIRNGLKTMKAATRAEVLEKIDLTVSLGIRLGLFSLRFLLWQHL